MTKQEIVEKYKVYEGNFKVDEVSFSDGILFVKFSDGLVGSVLVEKLEFSSEVLDLQWETVEVVNGTIMVTSATRPSDVVKDGLHHDETHIVLGNANIRYCVDSVYKEYVDQSVAKL